MIHSDLENPYNFIFQPPYEKNVTCAKRNIILVRKLLSEKLFVIIKS